MKRFIFIFSLFIIIGAELATAESNPISGRTVLLDIQGKKYENISMKVVNVYANVYYIKGISSDKIHWLFNIPDSIAHNIWSLQFYYTYKNDKHGLSFAAVMNNDTLTSRVNNFECYSDTLDIKGVFLKNDFNSHNDIFKVDVKEKTFLMESMKSPGFGFFYDPTHEKKYEDFLEDFKSKIIANPNSSYYITNLSAALGGFRSTTDVKTLFDLFSTSVKKSDYGKRIYDYLNPVFENIQLPLVNNENQQVALIQDFSKYNLIELSASWCYQCKKIIPILKELNEQYKDNLSITYVSIDSNTKDLINFRRVIKKEHISWRSLWLKPDGKNRNNFLYKTSIKGIPCGVLVNPDGKIVDYFNFNRPGDLNKFHRVIQAR